jgi:predicted ATP-dependent serine protease
MNKGLERLSTEIENHMNSRQTIHEQNRVKYKIDVDEEIPLPQIAWSLTNIKTEGQEILGTLGNFSLIIGKAKVKKSFFISIAISTSLSNDLMLERFSNGLPNDKNEILYFDTEQSKYHVQKAVKRICELTNQSSPKNLQTFYLRSLQPTERLQFIETEIYSNEKIGFVVIDGIKDLVTSINDEEQATMIVSKLMKWSEERNLHIVTVLHQNKSDTNARGHIGTELINKAETVLEVAKSEIDDSISVVTPLQCRNKEPEVFAFEINDFGLPVISENFELRTATKKNKFDVIELEDYKKYQLLTEVFSKGKSFGYKELEIQIKLASKNQFGKELGTNNITTLITFCKNKNWLMQEKPKGNYTIGIFKE